MIKRHYFISGEKLHGDGHGSYSFNFFIVTKKSWLPKPKEVFDEAFEEMKRVLKEKPGKNCRVIAFNRI